MQNSKNLENFRSFLNSNSKEIPFEESDLFKNVEVRTLKRINFDELGVKDCFVFSCVSGYFVKNL